VVAHLAFNPDIWVEDTSEISVSSEPLAPPPKSIRVVPESAPSAVRAATGSPPQARSRVTSDVEWRGLLTSLAAELSRGCADPPYFPSTVIKIRAAVNQPDAYGDDLFTLIEAEPRLSELIVVLANAALFGTGGKRVRDPRGAVLQLGRPIICAAAIVFAIDRMKDELRLRSIAAPLMELWRTSLAVACISQVIARRTKVRPEEAFSTGLLHGIGYLHIMARAVGKSIALGADLLGHELIDDTHPSIGKAALGSWGASEEMAKAVNDQHYYNRNRRSRDQADLSDILIVSIALAAALKETEPRTSVSGGITSFQTLDLTAEDCAKTLKHAEYQLGSLKHLMERW
jgi:HD-like signal output (HDOD) protein